MATTGGSPRFFQTGKALLALTVTFLSFGCPGQGTDTGRISVTVSPAYDSVSGFHRFWFGEGYRKLWAAPVQLKRFDFNRQSGGLTFERVGGGLQTKSLYYRDAGGKKWVLRSVQKYPERGLAPRYRRTLLRRILHDQVITTHPFAALTVPPFASALGIPHTNPQIVYMPDDPDLGNYRDEFKNTALLMEEAAPEDSLRTETTERLQELLEEDNGNLVDQSLVLRARLLDLLLGDWDRHEGQWRWDQRQRGGTLRFVPLPRDRDYVYYHTSGLLPWIVSHQRLKTRFQGFHANIRDVNGYNFNSRYFDRFFLTELSEEDWKWEVELVQRLVTDSLIESAVHRMPDTIVALSGKRIIQVLKARRENLDEIALSYYRYLSSAVDIPASDQSELFQLRYLPDGVELTIRPLPGRESLPIIYRRKFHPAVTREIRLYGRGGDDVFIAEGSAPSPIRVRLVGGEGVDSFYIDPAIPGKKSIYVYDRRDQENRLLLNGAKNRLATDTLVNQFDPRSFRYNYSGPVVSLLVNMDYGSLVTFGWMWLKQGFRKDPYASRQILAAGFSFARRSFSFRYAGDWQDIFGKYDLELNLLYRGPHNVSNFFGLGNGTVFLNPGRHGLPFYRNRYDLLDGDLRLKKELGRRAYITAGLAAQYYTSAAKNNRDKFLAIFQTQHPEEAVFGEQFYAGAGAGISLLPTANASLQVKGFEFFLDLRSMKQRGGEERSFTTLRSEASFSIPLVKDSGLVLQNRTGGGSTWGEPRFYQQLQLGGVHNLRGFNSGRFTGKTMLYNNTELSVRLFDFASVLFPGSFGLVGFYDVGRVWVPGEYSGTWHQGYGGGVYLLPANVILLKVIVGHSREINQVYANLSIGF